MKTKTALLSILLIIQFTRAYAQRCSTGSYAPNPVNCNTFLQCLHGHFIVMPCPAGLHWNKLAQTCDFPANANCQVAAVEPTGIPTKQPETERPNAPSEESNLRPSTNEPNSDSSAEESIESEELSEELSEAGDSCEIGSYATNPENCNSFLQCVHGKYKVRPCPMGLHWNNLAQTCDYPANAHCQEKPVEPTEVPTKEPIDPTEQSTTEKPTKPTEETSTEGPTEPSEETTTERSTEPSEETTTEGSTELSEETTTEGSTKPSEETTTEGSTEPSKETPTEGSTEPSEETTTEGSTEPSEETTTKESTEPCEETTTEGFTEQSEETTTEGSTEPSEETTTEGSTVGSTKPSEESTNAPDEPTDAPILECASGGTFPDPTDCSRFFKCVENQWIQESCTTGLHFNQETQLCDFPETAHCPFGCECGDEFSAFENCEAYYKCIDHRFVLQYCSPGLHWNSLNKECDWPQTAECPWDNNTELPTTEEDTTTDCQPIEITTHEADYYEYYDEAEIFPDEWRRKIKIHPRFQYIFNKK